MRYGIIGLIGLLASILAACATPTSEQATTIQATGEPTARTMLVYKSPTCGCCSDWVGYVEQHGYTVTVEEVQDLTAIKVEHQVPLTMQSCHTALIDGYIIEGHVPVADIERLLTERPDVVGIAVPGMPIGSPGMEVDGGATQPYDVLTFNAAGETEVYSSYQ